MNSPNPDIRLQDLLDRHASGTAAEALLAEARSLPDGQALAVDLALALALGRELPARLPAARRAAMQVALQEAFQAQQAAAPRRPAFAFLPGRLAFRLGAAVLACVLALGGGMVASAKSLPGDALYSLKRVTESARLAFSWSPESRARVWMELSDLRHQEIQDLDAAGRPMPDSLMTAWLDAHHQARQAAQASGDPALLQTVAEQAERHARDLEQLPQPGAGDAAEQLRDAAAQMPQAGEDPSMPAQGAQATLDPTPSPLPATATAVGAAGGAAGQDEPGPPVAATATSRPLSPRDAWRTGTPPSQATRDAWATERASRPTDAPGHGGRGGRGGRGDDPRRATEEARWATERARRGQEATPAPGQPTAEPRPTRPPLPPGIGPTQGPPPGPPMPTRRPSRTPDPQRTPGGGPGRPGPGEPGTPNPTWPPRRGTPPAPPTVAPDPSEQPLPTTLSGEVPTPVATPTPEARSLP